ncbi:hypothetical protein [Kitasatospora sp. MAP5-34]|uniref:hypothetical protein n=1 Tax=Kitasatospora sp. MAP5-34 TaxID=3035102 RepID=UPI00247597CC|nr:hypothetical protein [Kitasatospora sp. MAP5-34]MDH6580413.1 hypothetical protein [Kitasatospora sp. MAP5-34]
MQVAAADRLLQEDPFGPTALFSNIDSTAAAVAAAHWLYAAAKAVSEVSGYPAAEVVREADNIEALPHQTHTLVLELLDEGVSPYDAVTGLVRHAMRVADDVLPDPASFREQLDEAEETIAEYDDGDSEQDAVLPGIRLTPLDPRRPARGTCSKTSSPASTAAGSSTTSTPSSTRRTKRIRTTRRNRRTRSPSGTSITAAHSSPRSSAPSPRRIATD